MEVIIVLVIALCLFVIETEAFFPSFSRSATTRARHHLASSSSRRRNVEEYLSVLGSPTRLIFTATNNNSNNDEIINDNVDDSAEPGTMRVAEIKSELDLRGVDYSDCFDKESLAQKLVQARASGTADPSIIDQFNKQKQREGPIEIDDDILQKATGGDGTLPGGMPPDMLKQLMGNPEVMELMNNPKMQQVMKIMMTGGKDAIEIAMIEDKEIYELITKLNDVMTKAM